MGHVIFVLIHLVVVLFVSVYLLIITVPMHLIYGVLRSTSSRAKETTQYLGPGDIKRGIRHCPECREPIRTDARKCRYCGSSVEPISR